MAGSQYTEEEIRRSLLTLAKHGGNSENATAELNEQGIDIAARSLRRWREGLHADLYAELHELHGREIEASLVPEFRDAALAAARAAHQAIDQTVAQMDAGDLRDPASAARNLMVTAATSMDKLFLATDRPTEISEHRNADEILKALEARYPRAQQARLIEVDPPRPALPSPDPSVEAVDE